MKTLSLLPFFALILFSCAPATPGPKTVDHRALATFDQLGPGELEAAKSLKVYLEHASIGANLVEGLKALGEKGVALPILSIGTSEAPLSDAQAQVVRTWATEGQGLVENNRGNPGFDRKIEWFVDAIDQQQVGRLVDVAVLKFCFIDNRRFTDLLGFDAYLAAMDRLQAQNPALVLVYVTMPLETKADQTRTGFNARLRDHCAQRGLWLFDLADIESRGKDALDSDLSSDGAHLNGAGAEEVAKGWWVLLSRIAESRSPT